MLCYRYRCRFKTFPPSPCYRSHCLHSAGRKCVSVLPEGTSTGSAGCLFDLLIAKRNKTPFCPRSGGRKRWPALLWPDSLYFCAESQLVSCIKQARLSDRRQLTKLQRPSGAAQGGNGFYLFYPTGTKISNLRFVHPASFKSQWQEETNDTLCSGVRLPWPNSCYQLAQTAVKKNKHLVGLLSMWQQIHPNTLFLLLLEMFSGMPG